MLTNNNIHPIWSTSEEPNHKAATLAELLTHFTLKRPLTLAESSALCYQLLEQFVQHLTLTNSKNGVYRLLFPTLANIFITEEGVAFTRVSKANRVESTHDWLSALSQTLKSHTILAKTTESFAFQGLLTELSANPLKHSDLLEKIPIWLSICLQLCTKHYLPPNRYALNGQMADQISRGDQSEPIDSSAFDDTARQTEQILRVSSNIHDKEAFRVWTHKWHQVNLEYQHRETVNRGTTACSKRLDIQPNTGKTGKVQTDSPIFPRKFSFHTESLKLLYATIVGKHSGFFTKGLKEVQEQLKLCNLNQKKIPEGQG